MADRRTGLAFALLAPIVLVSPAASQDAVEETIGKIGDWSVRCAGVGTPTGVCYLVQRFERSGGDLVAEIIADPAFLAVRVPVGARLAEPMSATTPSGPLSLAWQTCTDVSCEAVLNLDATSIASLAAGTTLHYSGVAPVDLPIPMAGFAEGLGLLDAAAVVGVAALPEPVAPAPVIASITIRDVVFTPSGYLSEAELAAATDPFVGRRFRVTELGGLLAAVDALYADKGITLAQAILTSADPASGQVSIELFEARVGSVAYESGLMSDAYLAFRLGLTPGMLADNRLIQERLDRLSLTDGVTATANFQPGAARGDTDLTLQFTEPEPFWAYAGIDNFGSESTGLVRLSGGAGIRSLTGWNDPLSIDIVANQHILSGALNYSRIVHPHGTRLGVSIDASGSTSIDTPTVADRQGGVLLDLTHPIVVEAGRRWDAGASVLTFLETGTIAGAPLLDQRGKGVRVSSSEQFAGDDWGLALSQTATAIIWDDAITSEDGLFFLGLDGSLNASATVAELMSLSFAAAAQLTVAGDRAPARYQFGVSGPNAVRGYSSDLSKDDSGFYARLELGLATPPQLGTLTLAPFAFADIGRAADASDTAQDLLASAGLGMRFAIDRHVNGQIYAAKPLLDANGFDATPAYEIRGSLTASY